jgi:hypothetical protein
VDCKCFTTLQQRIQGDCDARISRGDPCTSSTVQPCKINCDVPDLISSQPTFTESPTTSPSSDPSDNGRGGPAGSSPTTTTVDPNGGAGIGPAPTGSGTSVGAGAVTATASNAASASPTPAAHPSSSGGLSSGAKAGIAVGVIVGVALIAFLAFCLFRNRRKDRSAVTAEEAKTLDSDQNGPSVVHQDPYSDSPATGTGYSPDAGRFSWMQAQSPTGPLATGGVGAAAAAAAAAPAAASSPTAQNQHTSRDLSEQEGAAYWQRSSTQMSNPPAESLAGVPDAAPRSSLQHERSPSVTNSPAYTAYSPTAQQPATSAAAAPATQAAVPEHDWDDDERRLEAEMAEIDRMRQERDTRAALG